LTPRFRPFNLVQQLNHFAAEKSATQRKVKNLDTDRRNLRILFETAKFS